MPISGSGLIILNVETQNKQRLYKMQTYLEDVFAVSSTPTPSKIELGAKEAVWLLEAAIVLGNKLSARIGGSKCCRIISASESRVIGLSCVPSWCGSSLLHCL